MFDHQFTDFCEDLVCALHVLLRKPVVYLGGSRDVGKQCIIGGNEVELQVGNVSQAVKYLMCWGRTENKCDIHLMRVCSLVGYDNGGVRRPISNEI